MYEEGTLCGLPANILIENTNTESDSHQHTGLIVIRTLHQVVPASYSYTVSLATYYLVDMWTM